jgi:hypothetical protein
MRKNLVALVVVGVVLLVADLCYSSIQRTAPFRVRVVDARTGAGVPNARVTIENGTEDTTAFDGSVLFWLDTALMNRTVGFTIEQRGTTTTVRVPVTPGGLRVLTVPAP